MFKKLASPRAIFISVYAVFLAVYIIIGLQPANASEVSQIISSLSIPSINLNSDVAKITLKDKQLNVPSDIVGEFHASKKNQLLMGHSTTVFKDLGNLKEGDIIYYNDAEYKVASYTIKEKSEIEMKDLLKNTGTEKITLMTCAGELLEDNDATRRLIVTANRIDNTIGVNK